jgi:hypothetical protein
MSDVKKVHAELVRNNLNISSVFVDIPKKGIVEISGFVRNLNDKALILSTINDLDWVSDVKSDIRVVPFDGD